MGGLAIYAACVIPLIGFNGWTAQTGAIVTGGTLLLAVGLLDDGFKAKARDFPVWPRLVVYLITSAVPLGYGIMIAGSAFRAPASSLIFLSGWRGRRPCCGCLP
ncbi:hypothetical protein N6H14_07285 [Paenibacillus sp. CC-CFT747]|nr:hypothetical protein N6H14_07285 [Paenibacillus sp. CC-CFT747]